MRQAMQFCLSWMRPTAAARGPAALRCTSRVECVATASRLVPVDLGRWSMQRRDAAEGDGACSSGSKGGSPHSFFRSCSENAPKVG